MCSESPRSSPRFERVPRGRRSAVRAGYRASSIFRAFRLLRPSVGEGVAHAGGGFRKGGAAEPPLRGALLVLFSRQGEKSTHVTLPDKPQFIYKSPVSLLTKPFIYGILSPSNDRGALHEQYPTREAAEAVGERRGCRSGCLGRAFDWPYGEYPSGCRRNAESYPHPTPSQGGSEDIRRFARSLRGGFFYGFKIVLIEFYIDPTQFC